MKTNTEIKPSQNKLHTFTRACGAMCQRVLTNIRQAKQNLLAEYQSLFLGEERSLQLAVSEAESIAWQTEFPHLVFFELALEKVQVLASSRQTRVLRASAAAHHALAT